MTKRPRSSVTTILANLVGRSVVSAITQTPASGPLALVTTPPRSLLPMRIAGAALCPEFSPAAQAAKSTAMPAAAIPWYNTLVVFIFSPANSQIIHQPIRDVVRAHHAVVAVAMLAAAIRGSEYLKCFLLRPPRRVELVRVFHRHYGVVLSMHDQQRALDLFRDPGHAVILELFHRGVHVRHAEHPRQLEPG